MQLRERGPSRIARPEGSAGGDPLQRVAPDIACLRTWIVNIAFVGSPGAGGGGWVLVDAGLAGSAGRIVRAAEALFGRGARPDAIVMTHGHFDHVGALRELAEGWDVPVYAHELELPYLTGRSSYPPPDGSVGGGLMARLAPLYPRGPVDLGGRARALPRDGSVPSMPGWRWIHTPGHTPGHVSLFRDADRALVAGDAFIATDQESALAALRQRLHVQGPPAYYTSDWREARASVERLAALEPELAVTGHGRPLRGRTLRAGLDALVRDFDRRGVPARGRYVGAPALADEQGVVAVPPRRASGAYAPYAALGLGAGLLALGVAAASRRRAERA